MQENFHAISWSELTRYSGYLPPVINTQAYSVSRIDGPYGSRSTAQEMRAFRETVENYKGPHDITWASSEGLEITRAYESMANELLAILSTMTVNTFEKEMIGGRFNKTIDGISI